MAIIRQRTFDRDQEKRLDKEDHLQRLGRRTKSQAKPSADSAALREMPTVQPDPVRISQRLACTEKGCPIPAAFLVSDQWGKIPYCIHHVNQLVLGRSECDRANPLSFVEGKNGRRQVDGMSIGRLPRERAFGMYTKIEALEIIGKVAIAGGHLAKAARAAEVDASTAKRFLQRANISVPSGRTLLSDEQVSIIKTSALDGGWLRQCAREAGCCAFTVKRILQKLGITVPNGLEYSAARENVKEAIYALGCAHLREIAKAADCSEQTARRHIKGLEAKGIVVMVDFSTWALSGSSRSSEAKRANGTQGDTV